MDMILHVCNVFTVCFTNIYQYINNIFVAQYIIIKQRNNKTVEFVFDNMHPVIFCSNTMLCNESIESY